MGPPERAWRLCAILKSLRCAEFPKLSRRRLDNSRFSPLIGERHTRCLVSINSAAQSRHPPAMLGDLHPEADWMKCQLGSLEAGYTRAFMRRC
jgi:hypothetical protein